MNAARSTVVALSNSEQQRETLVIMLDETFDVTAAPMSGARPRWPAPAAVVVAADPWNDDIARQARRRWPDAGLVLVDPPAPPPAEPETAVASWTDPFSVPSAVARVARRARRGPLDDAALGRAVRDADLALRPALEQAQALAALAIAARRPASVAIACRLLLDKLLHLVDDLAWTEWFETPAAEDAVADLAGALRRAVEERPGRALSRALEFDWDLDAPTFVPCAPEGAAILARSLRNALLDLPPGRVAVHSTAAALHLRHPALDGDGAGRFTAAVAACLARRAGVRLRTEPGAWTMELEHRDAADHA